MINTWSTAGRSTVAIIIIQVVFLVTKDHTAPESLQERIVKASHLPATKTNLMRTWPWPWHLDYNLFHHLRRCMICPVACLQSFGCAHSASCFHCKQIENLNMKLSS